jgi:hypothetical protein
MAVSWSEYAAWAALPGASTATPESSNTIVEKRESVLRIGASYPHELIAGDTGEWQGFGKPGGAGSPDPMEREGSLCGG